MAHIGDSCLRIGDKDWFIGSNTSSLPVVGFTNDLIQGMLNGYVEIAPNIVTETGGPLILEWEIVLKPHNSSMDINGLYDKNDNRFLAYLDKIGLYKLKLVVNEADSGCSNPVYIHILCTPFDYNQINQTSLDVSWIWQTLPDFWQLASNKDRARIEVFWRGINQLLGADLLSAYNIKESKSIATIQDTVIKRWIKIDTSIKLENTLINIIKPVTYDSQVLSVESGFIKKINQIPPRESSSYKFSCTIIGADRVQISNRFLSKADVGKLIKFYAITEISSKVILSANILEVEIQDSKCILTINIAFPIEDVLVNKELSAELLVRYSDFPIIVNGSYYTVLNTAGNEIKYARVPQIGESDQIKVDLKSYIFFENAEAFGISEGDLLETIITNLDNGVQYKTMLPISGCVANYIIMGDIDIYDKIYEICSSIEPDQDTLEISKLIFDYINTKDYRTTITSQVHANSIDTYIYISDSFFRTYNITFSKVYLRKKIEVPKDIINFVRIVERIERVELQNENLIPNEDDISLVNRGPIDLIENLDFSVDPDKIVGSNLSCDADLSKFYTNTFDFNFSGILNADKIIVETGLGRGTYFINKIAMDGSFVIVDPPSPFPFKNSNFSIIKTRVGGKRHLTFYKQLPDNPPINALWCEAALIDNNNTIDLNFGSLCNFDYSRWYNLNLEGSYKSIVTAILLARMSAPSINSLAKLTSAILGSPVVDTTSKIIDINNNFEVSPIDNKTPSISSMILEEIDQDGNLTGIYRTIKFKPNTLFTDENFSGLAINPKTKTRYKIGDTIEQFSVLALGVLIEDIYNEGRAKSLKNIKDRHRFKVTISTDTFKITKDSLELAYSFVLDIKPAYTNFIFALSKFIFDEIVIEEDVYFQISTRFFDNPYISQNIPQVLDEWTPQRQINDFYGYVPINVDFPSNGFISIFGDFIKLETPVEDYFLNLKLFNASSNIKDYIILQGQGDIVRGVIEDVSNNFILVSMITNTPLLKLFQINGNIKFTIMRPGGSLLESSQKIFGNDPRFVPIYNKLVGVGDYIYPNAIGSFRHEIKKIQNGVATVSPPLNNNVVGNSILTYIRRASISKKVLYEGPADYISKNEIKLIDQNAIAVGIEPGDVLNISNMLGYLKITAVKRDGSIFVNGSLLNPPIGHNLIIKITRDGGSDIGDLQDETVNAAISDCHIKISRPNSEKFLGAIFGNYIKVLKQDILDIINYIKLGDIIVTAQSNSELTEGLGVTRIVNIVLDDPNYVSIYLSENPITINVGVGIPISFDIIRQAKHKLMRIT